MSTNDTDLFNVSPEIGSSQRDERSQILSITVAARLLGIQRTQMWRYAKDGTLPTIVLGTISHPQHYFQRSDVLALKARRDAARTISGKRRRRMAQPGLRKLLRLIDAGEIRLKDLPRVRTAVS